MSQKKQETPNIQSNLAEIEIVTVGVKKVLKQTTPYKERQVLNSNLELTPRGLQLNKQPENQDKDGSNDIREKQNEEVEHKRKRIEENIEENKEKKMYEHNELEDSESLEQNEQNQEHQESNISKESDSKSIKKGPKSVKSESNNSQKKEELPSSRKCFNKLCTSKKIYKKIRSRVQQNKYRFFCKNCYENYYHNLYCQFCQQIYSNSCENEDDDKWLGCDNCERWNHIECEKKYRDKNINDLKDKNLLYECLVCSQKSKITNDKLKKGEKQQIEDKVVTKQKIQINKDQRILIFHKKNESFPNLEYFLQNYSFRLWINEGQIKEDIQYLKNASFKSSQEEGMKNKFKKVRNE